MSARDADVHHEAHKRHQVGQAFRPARRLNVPVVRLLIGLLVLANAGISSVQDQSPEVVAEVRIQGNVATSDAEILQLAGVTIGMPVGPGTVAVVTERLRATKRFERVEVLKRFASISDPSRIVLVVIVDEGPVEIRATGDPNQPTRVVATRRWLDLQLLPVLHGEDGYGFTYGVRLARADILGSRSRLSLPATWGGEKRVAGELEKEFPRGPITRVTGGVSISRIRNPFFDEDDERRGTWIHGERLVMPVLRIGASASYQHVSFLGTVDHDVQVGVDAAIDTRLDPWLPRNAIYVKASWDRLDFVHSASASRFRIDAQGYVGLRGQTILVMRALRDDSDTPLPLYLKPLLGGSANLRGFKAGTAIGDNLLTGSLELRAPLSSPFSIGKVGVNAFIDVGTVYDDGQRLTDQSINVGVGGGVWFSAAIVRFNVAVAHGIDASTRVHFAANLSF
jgi:outer membrane protein assembly factor BamA